LEKPDQKWPISTSTVFALFAGKESVRNDITKWFEHVIPYWNWSPYSSTTNFIKSIQTLMNLNLYQNEPIQLTEAGKISYSLLSEGDICLFAGFMLVQAGLE